MVCSQGRCLGQQHPSAAEVFYTRKHVCGAQLPAKDRLVSVNGPGTLANTPVTRGLKHLQTLKIFYCVSFRWPALVSSDKSKDTLIKNIVLQPAFILQKRRLKTLVFCPEAVPYTDKGNFQWYWQKSAQQMCLLPLLAHGQRQRVQGETVPVPPRSGKGWGAGGRFPPSGGGWEPGGCQQRC